MLFCNFSFFMFLNNANDIMEAQATRQKKTVLKFLKQAFQTQSPIIQDKELKQKSDLQHVISKMKVQRLKEVFYKKLTLNNVYQPARKLELLSEQQKDKKRLIKWKGFKLHQHLLSIIYILEIIFLVITFFISTCIAFLPDFIDSGTYNSWVVIGLNAATALLSCMKIGITSTTQTIKKGIMLVYITDILIAYARSLILFVDLIYLSIIITLFILRSASSQITNLGVALFIWSIIRISISNENLTYFRTTFLDSFKKEQYYKLFKVILFNFIFAHFIASMLLAMSELDDHQNWMISMKIYHEVWYVQYMWSYYWATTIMMTVGFGDFLPVTYKEGFIVSLIEFFSCIVLAYNISEIGGIISTIRASQDAYIAKLGIFKRMAQQNSVDLQLKIRIQDYLRQEKAIKQKFEFNQQTQLLDSLPQPLKKEFIMASNGKIFSSIPFFKSLHKNTLIQLTEYFTSKVYYPGEILSRANQHNNYIRILKDGKIGMTYKKENSILNGIVVQNIQTLDRQSLDENGQFVKMKTPILLNTQFLSPGKVVNYDMNALTYSYVFQLDHTQFMTIIKSSEMDTEYFFSIIHSTFLRKTGWEQFPCEQCQDFIENDAHSPKKQRFDQKNYEKQQNLFYHSKFQCPRLHYMPLNGIIILKYVRTPGQVQPSKPKYKRRKQRSQTCLLLRKKAFKIYERKRFINEKKDFQKFVQKSVVSRSYKNYSKPPKGGGFSQFRRDRLRKNSDGNHQPTQKKVNFNVSNFGYEYEQSQKENNKDDSYVFDPNEVLMSQSEEDDHKTIIESVVKYAIQEVYPRHISLIFWNLEIDMMWNYFNYFPRDNAARLDNMELVKNKVYRNKALCMVGSILNSSRVKDDIYVRNERKAYSMYEQVLNEKQIEPMYKRQSSMQMDLNRLGENQDYLEEEELETRRVQVNHQLNENKQFPQINEHHEEKGSTKKFLKIYSPTPEIKTVREKVVIKPAIKRYSGSESVINEDSIMIRQNQIRQNFNQSSSELNNCFN